MILYHYTDTTHWYKIQRTGFLKTVESNVSIRKMHAGPNVVWLSSVPDLTRDTAPWSRLSSLDKTAIRITVDIEDAIPWSEFAVQQRIAPFWRRALESSGGDSSTWFVVPRLIWRRDWREVRSMRDQRVIWEPVPSGVS